MSHLSYLIAISLQPVMIYRIFDRAIYYTILFDLVYIVTIQYYFLFLWSSNVPRYISVPNLTGRFYYTRTDFRQPFLNTHGPLKLRVFLGAALIVPGRRRERNIPTLHKRMRTFMLHIILLYILLNWRLTSALGFYKDLVFLRKKKNE